jgi:hypothetical protein
VGAGGCRSENATINDFRAEKCGAPVGALIRRRGGGLLVNWRAKRRALTGNAASSISCGQLAFLAGTGRPQCGGDDRQSSPPSQTESEAEELSLSARASARVQLQVPGGHLSSIPSAIAAERQTLTTNPCQKRVYE